MNPERQQPLVVSSDDTSLVDQKIRSIERTIRAGVPLEPGDILSGRFKLYEKVGRGGMSNVWKAYDTIEQELVAVKVLLRHYSEDNVISNRFIDSANKMAKLAHPGVVRIIEPNGNHAAHKYIAMEYLEGGTLEEAIIEKRLSASRAFEILKSVCDALSYVHTQGLIHKDFKPSNILLNGRNSAKIADFDLAIVHDALWNTMTTDFGTAAYSAPEIFLQKASITSSADIYSIGMTAAFCVYGKLLPTGEIWNRPSEFTAELDTSPRLTRVLSKAVSVAPENRHLSVSEFVEEFTTAIVNEPHYPNVARKLHEKGGVGFVKVPGGKFPLGRDHADPSSIMTLVELDPFWIGEYPVTVGQYSLFLEECSDHPRPPGWSGLRHTKSSHPIANVTWHDAMCFCEWAGLSLPTRQMWEAAARGFDERRYPWGNQAPRKDLANFDQKVGFTTPVGEYPKGIGPFGSLDQAGNVWEWCSDKVEVGSWNTIGTKGTLENPGDAHSEKGGSYWDDRTRLMSVYQNGNPIQHRSPYIGFRCAMIGE